MSFIGHVVMFHGWFKTLVSGFSICVAMKSEEETDDDQNKSLSLQVINTSMCVSGTTVFTVTFSGPSLIFSNVKSWSQV